ncbi:MAG: hypothetical protein ACYC3B_05345 [Sedimentisphaerales bacterium]
MRPIGYCRMMKFTLMLVISLICSAQVIYAGWADSTYNKTLSNSTLQAQFQAGNLYKLTNLATGQVLVNKSRFTLPATLYLFGSSSVNLNNATVVQTVSSTSVQTDYTWADGTTWRITWSLDGADLVLNTSAHSPTAKDGFFITLLACDIINHKLVTIDTNGYATAVTNPFTSGGDKNSMPWSAPQPLVALFEGSGAGWFLEGRDLNVGPSNIRPFGNGPNVDLVISRAFPETLATQNPAMFEVRIRTYSGNWENAVDPHLDWMQNVMGYVPVDQKPQTWVRNVRNQAYVTCGDYANLEALAARLNPAETYLGRQAEYRYYGFDLGYPDYRVHPSVLDWFTRAKALGFHVGVHTNVGSIDRSNTALIAQMEAGMVWDSVNNRWDGTAANAYVSAALPEWRNYLVSQFAEIVAAGVDVIYLDQTNGVLGKFVVNGVTGTQGVMLLEQQILDTYPNVSIQTEQFNPMASRHASFALSQMTLGHPLSGYIFSRFIKIVPEGIMYSPTDLATLDAFASYGFMVPGTDTRYSESWLQIVGAFQQFDLTPNSRLPRNANQLSGFSGTGGTTAFFEKTATTRSLVVYEPCQPPVSYGLRHTNITEWPGPGYLKDWMMFNGDTMLGLDPGTTYWFDEAVSLSPNRFHLTAIPSDYLPYANAPRRIISQELAGLFDQFRIYFSGTGQMQMFVPDDYDVYLGSEKLTVNRATDTAVVDVAATQTTPGVLMAYRRSEQPLNGMWSDLLWMQPQHRPYVALAYSLYPPTGFYTSVSGAGYIIGRFPWAQSIRVRGSYGMHNDSFWSKGDGVIKINGIEVLRVDPGSGPPYSMIPFDVDITAFSGKSVLLEFISDGALNGPDSADWQAPEIVVTGITGPATCEDAISVGYGFLEDFNGDCYLNMLDLEILAQDWLKCMNPVDAACERPWL